jgi:hypothetical protein
MRITRCYTTLLISIQQSAINNQVDEKLQEDNMQALNRSLGITMGSFALLMLAAYFGLTTFFEFPDILRTEPTYMLSVFVGNQRLIVLFYYLFALSQIVFIAIVLQFKHYYRDTPSMLLSVATGFGVLAGLCQAIGFLRWPFLTPYLASILTDPTASVASKQAAEVVFQAFHQFAGVAVGENLFFILEGVWGIGFGTYLIRFRLLSRQFAVVPIIAGALILIYSLEQFGGAMSALTPLNIIAHGALVFWFIALSKVFLRHKGAVDRHTRAGRNTVIVIWSLYLAIVTPGLIN